METHRRDTHDNPAWVAKLRFPPVPPAQKAPLCPKCGGLANLKATRFGPRAACCGLWSWDFKPLAPAETHEARKAAHAAFDPLWKAGPFDRRTAYAALAAAMGMTAAECHIASMTAEQARRVADIVQSGALQPPSERPVREKDAGDVI